MLKIYKEDHTTLNSEYVIHFQYINIYWEGPKIFKNVWGGEPIFWENPKEEAFSFDDATIETPKSSSPRPTLENLKWYLTGPFLSHKWQHRTISICLLIVTI